MHEEYGKTLEDPKLQSIMPIWDEIKSRLHFLSTTIRELERQLDVQTATVQALIQTVSGVGNLRYPQY